MATFTKAQVVALVSSCSKKGYRCEPLFQEIEKEVIQNIRKYSACDLSRIAFAFSSLQLGDKDFFTKCYFKIKPALKELDAVGIESCIYTFGQSDEKLALSKAMQAVILSKKSRFNPQDFVSVLVACSKMQIGDDDFLDAMELETLDRLEQFCPSSLALIASSFANALAGSYSFFATLEKRVLECIEQFESSELVMIYHAYSISRLADGKFLSKIERMLEPMGNLAPQDVVIMTWSMLLARSIEEKYLEVLLHSLNQLCESGIPKTINPQKLIEIEAMLKVDPPDFVFIMNAALLDTIERAKQENLAGRYERSSLQVETEEALKRADYKFTSKQFLDGVPVDILIDSEKLAIDVCEKSSYYRTAPTELIATSLIKKRLLESKGYKLLYLPYFEWTWGKVQQDLYLKELFAREYQPSEALK